MRRHSAANRHTPLRTLSPLLLALAAAALARDARADWPMFRRDTSRAAMATGPSDLARPVVAWRRYMGGAVSPTQLLADDVNGDGQVEVVFISGGKLVAKRADDSLVWESAPLALQRIDGVRDFNNDGVRDIVATGSPGLVAVFSGRDGSLQWRTVDTFGPSVGAVRFARLNADLVDDVYVAEANCGSTGQRGDLAYAYDFSRGFGTGVDDGAQRLWQLERGREYVCGVNDVVADLDGDNIPEVVAFATQNMYLFNGRTGRRIPSGGPDPNGGYPTGFSIPYGTNATDVVDVDGDGDLDIASYTNNSYAPSINSRAAFVVSLDTTRPAATRLYVRWVRNAMDSTRDAHAWVNNGAADFDGDRRVEVATTFVEAGVSTTYVLDGATGAPRVSIPNSAIAGVAVLAAGERPTLLVHRAGRLEGYRFTAPMGPTLPPPAFSLTDGNPLVYYDRARSVAGSASYANITVPLGGGSMARGLALARDNAVELWDTAAAGMPRLVGSYALPAGLTIVATAPQTDVVRTGPGILLARSDGYLLVLDAVMRVINFGDDPEVPLPGVRTGGFYSGAQGLGAVPIAARFDRSAAEIVAQDSRGVLLRLDASGASVTRAPVTRFEWAGARYPLAIDENGDGAHDLVVAAQGDAIEARRPDGATSVFRQTVLAGRQGFAGDVVPLRSTSGGAAATRYAAPLFDSGSGEGSIVATSPGAIAWRTTPIVTAGSGQGYLGVDDLDGDGRDDVTMALTAPLHMYSGESGAQLGAAGVPIYAAFPIVVRGRAGANVTHIATGSYGPPAGLQIARPPSGITTAWSFDSAFRATQLIGAVVQCPGGGPLVFANAEFGTARVVLADAATGAVRARPVLAGGAMFDTVEAAITARRVPGLVGNVNATTRLTGDQAALLVGSTDGHLYAIDPCGTPAARLIWALNLRAPVGEAILADTDGDMQEEIVVEAADGFLYGIDTERFPAPMEVLDIDPPNGVTDRDVDETRGSEVTATWTAVPGATGYEWAVFTAGATPVSRNPMDPANPFTPVDASTRVARHSAGLVPGGRYFFAVRALGAGGASAEAVSDGTRFVRAVLPLPDAGTVADAGDAGAPGDAREAGTARDGGVDTGGSGCGCRAVARGVRSGSGRSAEGLIALMAAVMVAAVGRGRRRRRRAEPTRGPSACGHDAS